MLTDMGFNEDYTRIARCGKSRLAVRSLQDIDHGRGV